jgi:hypothetical protein
MSEGPDDQPLSVQLPSSGTGARARTRQQRAKRRRTQQAWFTVAVVVLAAAIPVLSWVGFHRIITTTEGRRVDPQNDPTKPSYEVDVVPTPVALVVQQDAQNKLTGLTMLSLGANDTGGGVLFIPPATVTDDVIPDPSTSTTTTTTPRSSTTKPATVKTTTLEAAYASKGLDPLVQLTANVVGLSFGEVIVLTDDQLTQFVAPVAPLTIQNPDRLLETGANGKTTVKFAAGPVTLQAADVPVYLALRNPGETDLNRLARQQAVWQAWLAGIHSSSDPNAIPGERTEGLGRYLKGFVAGDVRFATLPATAAQNSKGEETFTTDAATLEPLVSTIVPLPTPANPGDRVRVRLLSGVGPLDVNAMLSTHLVPANAQVVIVGNADRFDYANSQIVYYDDAFADDANRLQQSLGVGEVVKRATATDTEDLTLIIGQDLVAKQNLEIAKGDGSG